MRVEPPPDGAGGPVPLRPGLKLPVAAVHPLPGVPRLSLVRPVPATSRLRAAAIGRLAARCLVLEVRTHPKPGLVSHLDQGAHDDMDAALLEQSAAVLVPWFGHLAAAGAAGAAMDELRGIGIEAERAMLAATGGVNTHRGAIFGLGLLAAAAGAGLPGVSLGALVAGRYGPAIMAAPDDPLSHGGQAARRYRAGGARLEAALGFPAVYRVGLPALRAGEALAGPGCEEARLHACMALIAALKDTNLLHRGGQAGLDFARGAAGSFMAAGGIARPGWRQRALDLHAAFKARRLSPGGAADLLSMTLFVRAVEGR